MCAVGLRHTESPACGSKRSTLLSNGFDQSNSNHILMSQIAFLRLKNAKYMFAVTCCTMSHPIPNTANPSYGRMRTRWSHGSLVRSLEMPPSVLFAHPLSGVCSRYSREMVLCANVASGVQFDKSKQFVCFDLHFVIGQI